MLKKQSVDAQVEEFCSVNFRPLLRSEGLRLITLPDFKEDGGGKVDGICNIPVWNLGFFSCDVFFFEAGWMFLLFPLYPYMCWTR